MTAYMIRDLPGAAAHVKDAMCAETHCRPVVVIDPEDREQVQRLIKALPFYGYEGTTDQMQAALRSLIAPPKPDEPTGLGAVVEDERGLTWVRIHRGSWQREAATTAWSNLPAVRVLSEGVES